MTVAHVLAVSSGGGHLKQLQMLLPRIGFSMEQVHWVTFDTGLSATLPPERTTIVPYAAPRDVARIAQNQLIAAKMLRTRKFSHVISTGASLAVCYLPLAALHGSQSIYIESATRGSGPSLTGRLLRFVPRVRLYSQYESWSDSRWQYAGSVFDEFTPESRSAPKNIRKVVVSLGTTESYKFDRLLERLVPLLEGCEVLWQVGPAGTNLDIPGARATVDSTELRRAILAADVVISHAGTGSALTALELGKIPVLAPRSAGHGEHVDDHQYEIAKQLSKRGLAVVAEPAELDYGHLRTAAGQEVMRITPPDFLL